MVYFSFVLFGNNMVTACVDSIKKPIQFSVSARPLQEVWSTLIGAKNIQDFMCSAYDCINKYTKLRKQVSFLNGYIVVNHRTSISNSSLSVHLESLLTLKWWNAICFIAIKENRNEIN